MYFYLLEFPKNVRSVNISGKYFEFCQVKYKWLCRIPFSVVKKEAGKGKVFVYTEGGKDWLIY